MTIKFKLKKPYDEHGNKVNLCFCVRSIVDSGCNFIVHFYNGTMDRIYHKERVSKIIVVDFK